jgi:hypothetical protein
LQDLGQCHIHQTISELRGEMDARHSFQILCQRLLNCRRRSCKTREQRGIKC